jgi:hypothetical protein
LMALANVGGSGEHPRELRRSPLRVISGQPGQLHEILATVRPLGPGPGGSWAGLWVCSGGSSLAPGPLGSVAGDPDRHRGWLLCPSSVPAVAGRGLRPRVFSAHSQARYVPRHRLQQPFFGKASSDRPAPFINALVRTPRRTRECGASDLSPCIPSTEVNVAGYKGDTRREGGEGKRGWGFGLR